MLHTFRTFEECVHEAASYLRLPCYQLSPTLPLGAAVPLLESGFVGLPAAVLVVEPEANEADAVLHVRQPVRCNVDATGQGA